jgi:hypothetical protein
MFRYLYHLVNLLSTILVFVFDTTLEEMADQNPLYDGAKGIEGEKEIEGEEGEKREEGMRDQKSRNRIGLLIFIQACRQRVR